MWNLQKNSRLGFSNRWFWNGSTVLFLCCLTVSEVLDSCFVSSVLPCARSEMADPSGRVGGEGHLVAGSFKGESGGKTVRRKGSIRRSLDADEFINLLHGSDPVRVELNRLENEVRGLFLYFSVVFS